MGKITLVVAFAIFGVIFSVLPSAYAQTSDVEISEQTTLSGDLLNDPTALEILQKIEESKRTIAKLDEVTIEFLETTYSYAGTAIIRVTDADMNFDPEAVDNFDVDVWSDSDLAGIDLTVTETNETTGIFEGTVFFSTEDDSSGHRLRVSPGDAIYSTHYDRTTPKSSSDDTSVFVSTALIKGGSIPKIDDRISLDKEFYQWGDDVFFSITAPELNTNSDLVEEISNSNTFPIEINTRHFEIKEFTLVETGADTGIFSGKVFLTTENLLSVHQTDYDNDGITVSFEYQEDLVAIGSAQIGDPQFREYINKQCDSGMVLSGGHCQTIKEEKVDTVAKDILFSFENPSVLDLSENMTDTVFLGQQYRISTDVTNHQETAQRFAYTVEIVNVDDSTELANAMLEGELHPEQEFTLLLPWEPVSCGNFVINFAIHDNITDKNSLGNPLSLPVTIEGCASTDSTSDDLFASIQQFFASLFS